MELKFQKSKSGHINLNIYAFKCHITFWNQFTLSYWISVLLWWQKWTDLCSINLKKVIYSTGFYSPPGIKNEANTSIQLSMWSFAAETRRFGHKRPNNTKILSNFGLILILSVAETTRAGPAKIKIKTNKKFNF